MMYRMINANGNAVCEVASESERDELMKRGYTEDAGKPEPKPPKKKGNGHAAQN